MHQLFAVSATIFLVTNHTDSFLILFSSPNPEAASQPWSFVEDIVIKPQFCSDQSGTLEEDRTFGVVYNPAPHCTLGRYLGIFAV